MNFQSLKLPNTFAEFAARKAFTSISTRKPGRTDWQMAHPEWILAPVAMLSLENVSYVLTPDIASGLHKGEFQQCSLHPAITTSGDVFIWPVRISEAGDGWGSSMRAAVAAAQEGWVRVTSNMGAGRYDVHRPLAELAAPAWPDLSFDQMLEIAFKDILIALPDHPVLRHLRGDF